MNENYTIDRSDFGPGPWDTEPEDRIEWRSQGLPCLMVRNSLGSWCGYVAINSTHPWFKKSYNDIEVEIHGGLTYSDHCDGPICHVPLFGESDLVWWLGFDCAHYGDLCPGTKSVTKGTYRDITYVHAEVEHLVMQVNAVKT